MRLKKQVPDKNVRRVSQPQSANVFSYYANRSASENVRTRRGIDQSTASKSRHKMKFKPKQAWLSSIPSFAAAAILIGCLLYISTLGSDPKLQIVGSSQAGMVSDADEYESGIQKILQKSLASKSKLLINTDELAAVISNEYPELGDISVVLPLIGRRPIVHAQPATPSLVLTTMEGGFALDSNGRIMSEARDLESSVRDKLPVLRDESGLSLEVGNYAMSKESVKFIQDVAEQLKRKDITVQAMTLPTIANEMHLRVVGNSYYVKFNLRDQSRVQAGAYIATRKRLVRDNVVPREYIDVRVPGKVYYK